MGLQISRDVYTEAAQEADIRSAAATLGRDVSRIGFAQGVESRGRALDGRPRAYVLEHSAEVLSLECGRVLVGMTEC